MYLAKVIFYGQEKGGRSIPPQSGYKPQIEIGGIHTSCFVYGQLGVEIFNFEKVFIVRIELMYPNEYGGRLKPGDPIKLYEGNKQVAEGQILECV